MYTLVDSILYECLLDTGKGDSLFWGIADLSFLRDTCEILDYYFLFNVISIRVYTRILLDMKNLAVWLVALHPFPPVTPSKE